MNETRIHTVRKICPGFRDSLHQQPEDNNIRLISSPQTNHTLVLQSLRVEGTGQYSQQHLRCHFDHFGPKSLHMLEQSFHCLPGAYDGLQSGGEETGVNMETKTRFAVC